MKAIADICFTLDRLTEEADLANNSPIKWSHLFDYYDQEHVRLRHGAAKKIDDGKVIALYKDAASILARRRSDQA